MLKSMIPGVLASWIVVVIILFMRWPKRQAVVAAIIAGWLFLPVVVDFENPYTPPPLPISKFVLTKMNAISYGILFGALFFDLPRWLAFRPKWFDIPLAVWIFCPMSSLWTNQGPDTMPPLTFVNCIFQCFKLFLEYGVPYLVGRIYLGDRDGFRVLCNGILLGGLAYVFVCLYEVRMSPNLHEKIYGYAPHSYIQLVRDGYRPMAFMEHGLMVGMWMGIVSLLAFWLIWTGNQKEVYWWPGMPSISVKVVMILLLINAGLALRTCKGAMLLSMAGAGILFLGRWQFPLAKIAALLLALVPPIYVVSRTTTASEIPTGWLDPKLDKDNEKLIERLERTAKGKRLVGWAPLTIIQIEDWLKEKLGKERAESALFRFVEEDKMMEKAQKKPWFGWGGDGRGRIKDIKGRDITVSDGLWIIVFGDRGFVGVFAIFAFYLLPAVRFLWVHPQKNWPNADIAPAIGLSVALILFMVDGIQNNMVNPVFAMTAGALASYTLVSLRAPAATETRRAEATMRPEPAQPEAARPGVLRRSWNPAKK